MDVGVGLRLNGYVGGGAPVANLLNGSPGAIPESAAQSTTPMMDWCQLALPRQTGGGTIRFDSLRHGPALKNLVIDIREQAVAVRDGAQVIMIIVTVFGHVREAVEAV